MTSLAAVAPLSQHTPPLHDSYSFCKSSRTVNHWVSASQISGCFCENPKLKFFFMHKDCETFRRRFAMPNLVVTTKLVCRLLNAVLRDEAWCWCGVTHTYTSVCVWLNCVYYAGMCGGPSTANIQRPFSVTLTHVDSSLMHPFTHSAQLTHSVH